MQVPSSIFKYFYRDAGNFKTYGQILLSGSAGKAEDVLRNCLEWDGQFVAEQVGIPSLCREHWRSVGEGPSDLDHAYHEFDGIRDATNEEQGMPLWGSLDELLIRMRRAAGKWDVTLSPNWDL